ncbi:hypothetical protein [Solimicrobium silvestre]|uniref:Uncharacterized protein n=1 Tax=Solimicrobium silvestre TaxID=2099400 RepID=A0A2S9GUY1_9BURK|nr:hypothetical protein [Solimicrobium silvestre]PRC91542.1 hypothetical protein S2091_3820 [Solimicrobium silvestre]
MHTPFPETHQRPWLALNGVDEAEIWVANSNLELNYFLEQEQNSGLPIGQGICFALELGGELFLHTTSEGILLLDVTEAAEWVVPIIAACTGAAPARGQIWILPEDTLIQLILGLNSLIASSSIVLRHDFGMHF